MHSAKREGTVHIAWTNRGTQGEPKYDVVFLEDASPRGAMNFKEIVGEDALASYLRSIEVREVALHSALRDLKRQGAAMIFHALISDKELITHGLK